MFSPRPGGAHSSDSASSRELLGLGDDRSHPCKGCSPWISGICAYSDSRPNWHGLVRDPQREVGPHPSAGWLRHRSDGAAV
jgi:hypothetical protein